MRNKIVRFAARSSVSGSAGASAPRLIVEPWALRLIGRRGALMRHAALQTLAVASGGTLDVSRLPRDERTANGPRAAVEPASVDRGEQIIVVEN